MSVRDRDLPANCGYKADKILETPQPEQPPAMSDVAAPLTASEKITFRRIALGSSSPRRLPEDQVSRLQRLNLIKAVGSGYQLTPQGKEYYEALARPTRRRLRLSRCSRRLSNQQKRGNERAAGSNKLCAINRMA